MNICLCIAWSIYLADSDMFLSSQGSSLDQIIFQIKAANELFCSRLCKKTDGCNAFSFLETSGQCDLARGSIVGPASGFVYTRLAHGPNATQSSVTTAPVTTAPVTTTPVTIAPVTTTPVETTPITTSPDTTSQVTTTQVRLYTCRCMLKVKYASLKRFTLCCLISYNYTIFRMGL